MLLSNIDSSSANQLIAQQKSTIEKQSEEIARLQTPSRGANADAKLKEVLAHYQSVTAKYIELLSEESSILPVSLKPQTWNSFTKTFSDRSDYEYPAGDCFCSIKLEAICYGKGRKPALFLWGINVESGQKLKFRFYKKRDYIGIPIPHSPFLYKGAHLLVGYKRAPDEAVDLYIALPLSSQSNTLWSQAVSVSNSKYLSLDALIERSQLKG